MSVQTELPISNLGIEGDSTSPNGGSTVARDALHARFAGRLGVNPSFTRKTVSYQGNRKTPGFRWMKYKEAFSRSLVDDFLNDHQPTRVLDPFAGMGTAVLTAAGRGLEATGVEIMPVGVLAGTGIAEAANGLSKADVVNVGKALIKHIRSSGTAPPEYGFAHVRITRKAFSAQTERDIAKAREYIAGMEDGAAKVLMDLACLSVLEQVSYTRKDGQFLRWDNRSGRSLRGKMHKGDIPSLEQALSHRLQQMASDLPAVKKAFGGGTPEFITGSSLDVLREFPDDAVDLVITSPPYANRYDYTRTYALELAWMGFNQEGFNHLRQQMLSATVENHTKVDALRSSYVDDPDRFERAVKVYENQKGLHEVLDILRSHIKELANRHVIRLLEGYFLEMSVIVSELSRIVQRGGHVVMVNDNVQYHGEEVPVDLILSDIAEQLGFECVNIWKLARGKGNASQQMGRFGRREIRKCVYRWKRT